MPAVADLYPPKIKFQHILRGKDVVLGEVRAIFQDSEGYMWFGGWNALVRYDGYNFKQVNLNIIESGIQRSVPLGNTVDIFEDSKNRLWFATSRGLIQFDREQERLVPFPDSPDQEPISKNFINQIIEVPTGELIVGSEEGLFIVDPSKMLYEHIDAKDGEPESPLHPRHPSINTLLVDKQNNIWLGTNTGLDKFNLSNKTFNHVKLEILNNSIGSIFIQDMVLDESGALWLGTNSALRLFNPSTKYHKAYRHEGIVSESLARGPIWDLNKDSKGRLWISHDLGGLDLYIPHEERFLNYQHRQSQAHSLSSNKVRVSFEDSNGDIWVGLYPEGIEFFDQSSTAITVYQNDDADTNSLSYDAISSISEDVNGNFWLGTDGGGLNYFNRKDNKFIKYSFIEGSPYSLPSNSILSSMVDRNGDVWVGTWGGGAARIDKKTKLVKSYPFSFEGKTGPSKVLQSGHVWSILQDSQGIMWFATHTAGLSRLNLETDEFYHYIPTERDSKSISSSWVWTVYEDSKMNFWVGTSEGLDLLNRKTGEFRHFVHDTNDPSSIGEGYIFCIFEDSKNRLWIGLDSGLNLFHPEEERFAKINQGFYNSSIRSIVEDDAGAIWVGTANGVSSFNPETGEVDNYYRDSGQLVGSFFYNAGLLSRSGEVVFGGVNGLRIYRPSELKANTVPPPVVFTDLKIFSESVKVGSQENILQKTLNYTSEITLDYTKSMFVFEFAALNFRSPEKNKYAYKLEGFDKEWLYVGDEKRAKYTNLNPGTYNFRVKASNNDDVWNEQGRSIKVIQLPPPWKTWWAYTLYLLFIFWGLIIIYVNQKRKQRKVERQNQVLERRVAERTDALQREHEMLKQTQSQLVQSESIASVNNLVSGMLHEINNPTNFVSSSAYHIERDLKDFESFLYGLMDDSDSEIREDFILRFKSLFTQLSTLSSGVERIGKIVKDLKMFSDLDRSVNKNLNLHDGLEMCVEVYKASFSKRIIYDSNELQDLEIYCNPAEISQVFMNIMSNACWAIEEKTRSSSITSHGVVEVSLNKMNDFAVVDFCDNGCGMSEETKQHLFDPFYTTKVVGQGVGLGLSIAYGIVEKHHGKIEVLSELGHGSQVRVFLPLGELDVVS